WLPVAFTGLEDLHSHGVGQFAELMDLGHILARDIPDKLSSLLEHLHREQPLTGRRLPADHTANHFFGYYFRDKGHKQPSFEAVPNGSRCRVRWHPLKHRGPSIHSAAHRRTRSH